MKRRTSVSLKKHGEWLAGFNVQENVLLIVWTLRKSRIAHTQLRKTELHKCSKEKCCAKCCFFAQNVTQRKQNFAFRSAKFTQKFCERKSYARPIIKLINAEAKDYMQGKNNLHSKHSYKDFQQSLLSNSLS